MGGGAHGGQQGGGGGGAGLYDGDSNVLSLDDSNFPSSSNGWVWLVSVGAPNTEACTDRGFLPRVSLKYARHSANQTLLWAIVCCMYVRLCTRATV